MCVELLGGLYPPTAHAWSLGVLRGGRRVSLQHGETALEELQKQGLGTDAFFPWATERQRMSESKNASCFYPPSQTTIYKGLSPLGIRLSKKNANQRQKGGKERTMDWVESENTDPV